MKLFKKLAAKLGIHSTLNADDVIATEKAHIESAYSQFFDSQYDEYLQGEYRQFVERGYPDHMRQCYPQVDPGDYPQKARPWYGLALSGGGIRSASFAIGVIQGLHNRRLFDKGKPTLFDRVTYLSTASGGGYTGSALSWYQKIYNLFPFGNINSFAGSQYSQKEEDKTLSYIRQHGKYLTPAQLGISSLLGTVLLSVIHSIAAYTLLFSLLMYVLTLIIASGIIDPFLDYGSINSGSLRSVLDDLPLAIASLRNETLSDDKISFSVFFLTIAMGLGMAFLATVFVYGLASFFRNLFAKLYCYRIWAQKLLGLLLQGLAASLFFAAIPIVVLLVFGATLEHTDPGLLGSLGSGVVSIVLAIRQFRQKTEEGDGTGFFSKLFTTLSALVFIFFIFLGAYILAETIHETSRTQSGIWPWPLAFVLAALLIPVLVNINQVSPHKMYRDRLMETFLKPPGVKPTAPLCDIGGKANDTRLAELAQSPHWSPYHLINCNIILNNAITPRYRGRLGDSFVLSPLYCGSDATRYVDTATFANGSLTLATAMSISGAAENPHAGVSGVGNSTNPYMAFLMTFLGLRLGYWAFNPLHCLRPMQKFTRPNYLFPGLRSLFNYGHAERSLLVELSDGGHFDNTALYELVRRRTPVIILSDGSADPFAAFDDFGNAVERIRVDFGVSIRFPDERFDLAGLIPGSQAAVSKDSAKIYDEKYILSERGYAIGDIIYPATATEKAFVGRFVFIKASLTRNLPGDLYAYKAACPSYPNQPTLDQFFDERQFESYRELGYQLTKQFVANKEAMALMP